MENKKTGVIIAIVAVILFIGVAFIFLYEPARNVFTKPPVVQQEEVTGDLPVLECNYTNDQEVYKDAITKKDVNLCDCVSSEELQNKCKKATMDITFYDQALTQLDELLCEKISSEIKKDACYSVVQSSVTQFEKEDPEYLARVYAASHNEKAIGELETLTAEDQENVDAYIALALAYAAKGLREQEQGNDQTPYVNKALEAVESAKQIDNKNSEVYRAEAYANEIKPDYAQALTLYDKAIALSENNALAHAGKGHTLRMMGILEGAVEEFNKAAELDVNNANVFIYTNLCSLEYSRSHDEEAIKNCKTVTQIENTDPVFQSEAYQIMSDIFIKNNDIAQAKNYLLQAKTLTPNNPNLFVAFSKLNFFDQKFVQAEADARKAIELSPTKSASYLALARALYMQEKYNEAIEAAQKGITLVSSDVSLLAPSKSAVERDLNYVIANSYRQMGDTIKQKEYEQKAKDAFENTNSLTE